MSIEILKRFWTSIGVEVIIDEVGYQRADNFHKEIGLNWSQNDWRIYQGKVYVKPEYQHVVQQRLRTSEEAS